MSVLALVPTPSRSGSPRRSPWGPATRVRVSHAVRLLSGRRVRAGDYAVAHVLCDNGVVVFARPDCTAIDGLVSRRFPSRQTSLFRLRPGEFTAFDGASTGDRHPPYIHDR